MIVYAESNYLLELAFEQEEAADCLGVLELAESRRVSLVLPAFSVGECLERLGRRKSKRETIQQALRDEIRELSRSAPTAPLSDQLHSLTVSLIAGARADEQRYEDTLRRILGCAEFIPLDAAAIRGSLDARMSYGLTSQDALVFTCVMTHLATTRPTRAVFLNRNRKDFANPDILAALDQLNCALKTQFTAGLAYVRAELARVSDPPSA